jgi:hypothetical protein
MSGVVSDAMHAAMLTSMRVAMMDCDTVRRTPAHPFPCTASCLFA